ncbi:hypothetical protein F443_01593 [Phytophthora nicotianae P1569]|uniref:RxLR effector protein n=1 Tax=Phytophthora nicotianae P1569 TaxID=1317065 RepID=V9FXK1_PHYNI|nr:hypothetical protein F443_01593 [Phytophthora nicotianae P1569]
MRQSFLLVVLVLAFAAGVQGLTGNENAALTDDLKSTNERSNRNLKGSSTTTAEEEERGVTDMLKKAVSPITKIFGTNTASKVKGLQADAQVVNSIKSDQKLQKLGSAIAKNPGALTEKKVGKIGEFIEKLKKIEFVGDVKGMRIAYGILFLAIFGIIGTGFYITRNVENSYIRSG